MCTTLPTAGVVHGLEESNCAIIDVGISVYEHVESTANGIVPWTTWRERGVADADRRTYRPSRPNLRSLGDYRARNLSAFSMSCTTPSPHSRD